MQDNEQRRQEVYKYFKDNLNIDFNSFTPQKARMVVDEMNKKLDEQIAEEKRKNIELTNMIYTERNRIMELTQELYG